MVGGSGMSKEPKFAPSDSLVRKDLLLVNGEESYDSKLWTELMEVGKKIEKRETHEMPTPMINAIVETLRYFGLDEGHCKMAYFDLKVAKYRIFDWLGMAYTGRLDAKKGSELFSGIEKMVKLYVLQKNVGGFCWFLRGHDLDVSYKPVFRCPDCIKSYKNWMEEIKENGGNPEEYI